MASLVPTRSHKQFGGHTRYFTHDSAVCNRPMSLAVYLPSQVERSDGGRLPVLYWLSGLTCTEEIFMTEAHAQGLAEEHGMILVAPDTSPRNTGIEGEDERDDLGSGAGFYVDATEKKWARHYRMDSYVTRELRQIVESELPIDPRRRGIFGHSMGGHGALVLGLRNPELYRSISAFAPICVPSKAPWGIRAFTAYLGSDRARWADYDAEALLGRAKTRTPILIDQGLEDEFLKEQLFTERFAQTARSLNYPATIRFQPGYDHSYYFVSTFIGDHLAFHARNLSG